MARPWRVVASAGLVVMSAALGGCGGPLTTRGAVDVAGGPFELGAECDGSAVSPALRQGGPVLVEGTDASGPIAAGVLGPGAAEAVGICRIPFIVEGIPRGFEEYSLVIFDSGVGQIVAEVRHLSAGQLGEPHVLQVGR